MLLGALVLAAALDRSSKAIARARLAGGRIRQLAPGIALGLRLNSRAGLLPLPLTFALILSSLLAALVLLLLPSLADPPPAAVAGIGLALGGSASNLWDRLSQGGVLDFISLGRWPVFNLADAALVGGVLLTLGSLL